MRLFSTFADVYFKDLSAPLESICYLGPHAWYIKENEIKQSRQKKQDKKEEKTTKTTRINTDTTSMQMIYTAIIK